MAASRYKRKELQDALKNSQESGENVPEKEVVKKVLGTRSGHTRGVGRKLKGFSSSSSVISSSSIGEEDEEYEGSDDEEMEVLDEDEDEDEEINDGDDSVE
nr:hypothetical protein [Tanacetum cinerariifolium]